MLAGVQVTTITSWLSRNKPRENPFPTGRRLLYGLYWPLSEIQACKQPWQQPAAATPAPHAVAEPAVETDDAGDLDSTPRELRPGEQLRLTRQQLEAYALVPVGVDSAAPYRVELAGRVVGTIERPANRRTGWQARTTGNLPMGSPARSRELAVIALLDRLDLAVED